MKRKINKQIVTCQQTHSANIHIVEVDDVGKEIPNCDGLITNIKNINLQIKTADCAPISLRDDIKKVVGIVHAGWRGTQSQIIKNAINLMVSEFKSKIGDIKIKIGPTIDKANYLVKVDVAGKFLDKYPGFLEKVSTHQWTLDLVGVNIKQMLVSGILNENIDNSKISTYLDKSYPSFRRDGKTNGFITGVILN